MTVRRKIFISLVSFSAVPILLLAAVWLFSDAETKRAQYSAMMRAVAQAATASFNDMIATTEEHITLLATSWNMREYLNITEDRTADAEDKARAAEILRENFLRYVDNVAMFDDVVLLDSAGQVAVACDTQVTGRDLSGMDYFLDHVNSSTVHTADYVYNGVVHDSLTQPDNYDMRNVAFSQCIRNGDGSVRNVLVSYVNADMLGRAVDGVTFGKTGIIYVIDANNYILYHPDPNFVNFYTVAPGVSNLIERYESGEIPRTGALEDSVSGVARLIYYDIMADLNMALILRQDAGDLQSENSANLFLAAAAVISVLAASGLAGLFLSKKFARPFLWLSNLFRQGAGQGGLAVPDQGAYKGAGFYGSSEVAGITAGYKEMVTRLERQEEIISAEKLRNEYVASHDRLTGLLNRPAFELEFKSRVKSSQQVGLIFMDIGRFKQINNIYDNTTGDGVLAETARRIENSAAGFDLCARAGNDQFMMAKRGTAGEIKAAMQTVIKDFKEPVAVGKNKLNVTVYLGAAMHPSDGATVDMLMSSAGIAMRSIKETERSAFVSYDIRMREKMSRSGTIADVLRDCIKENEIFLMYQPFYNINTNAVLGFEALMRIRSKQLGLLSPKEFIPIAETDPQLISELGSWAITEALRFIRRAMDRNDFAGYVSVNISVKQLDDPGFADKVLAALEETGVAAERLQLEITEPDAPEDIEKYTEVFNALRSRGVGIAMDNFGDLMSSFYFLTHLPLDSVKVDQPFFAGLGDGKRAAQINKALLDMARRFGIKISAERVESQTDFDLLKSVGYDTAQGFHFSLPLLEESAMEIIESSR